MKKLVFTLATIFAIAMTSFAAPGNGFFKRGTMDNDNDAYGFMNRSTTAPELPDHGWTNNYDADGVPLGSGALLLIGFGAAFALIKKNKENE